MGVRQGQDFDSAMKTSLHFKLAGYFAFLGVFIAGLFMVMWVIFVITVAIHFVTKFW